MSYCHGVNAVTGWSRESITKLCQPWQKVG